MYMYYTYICIHIKHFTKYIYMYICNIYIYKIYSDSEILLMVNLPRLRDHPRLYLLCSLISPMSRAIKVGLAAKKANSQVDDCKKHFRGFLFDSCQ